MKTTGDAITALLAPMPRLLPAKREYLHWVANKMCTSQTSTILSHSERKKRQHGKGNAIFSYSDTQILRTQSNHNYISFYFRDSPSSEVFSMTNQ